MKKLTLFLCAMLLATSSFAGNCIVGPLYSDHKMLHLAGNAALVSFVSVATNDPIKGVVAGVLVSAAREYEKASGVGTACEYSSMAWDAAGIALGYYVSNKWLIVPQKDGVVVGYHTTF